MPLPGRGGVPQDPGFGFIQWGEAGAVATGTGYANPFGFSAINATENNVQYPAPRDCYLWQLRVHVNPVPTGAFVSTLVVRVENANTLLSVVLNAANGANVSDLDLAHQFAVTAGQRISLRLVTVVGVGVSFSNLQASLRLY